MSSTDQELKAFAGELPQFSEIAPAIAMAAIHHEPAPSSSDGDEDYKALREMLEAVTNELSESIADAAYSEAYKPDKNAKNAKAFAERTPIIVKARELLKRT